MTGITQTVPVVNIVFMAISGSIALALPIVLYFVVRRRYRARLTPALIGTVTFVVFARVLEQLFHGLVLYNETIGPVIQSNWWAFGLYGGLAAGLFEETGRLCAFFFLLRGHRNNNLGGALSYGIGHGGIEAILSYTVIMAANLICAVAINTGNADLFAMVAGGQDAAQAAAVLSGLAPVTLLLSLLERVIAIAFHMAASVLVWMSATSRGPWGLFFLAIAFHAILDFPAALFQFGLLQNALLLEAIFAVLAGGICVITYSIYKRCSQFYTPLLQYEPGDFSL